MIETFTPEEISAVADEKDRVPSSSDQFVRYEDHVAAVAAARGDQAPIRLPEARTPKQVSDR